MPGSYFPACLQLTLGAEGGFTRNPADPGNWTGGRPGVGELRGTKFGISASAHPDLDIEHLTLTDVATIYRPGYWDEVQGDKLPAPLVALVFDAAVNSGPDRARRWLQAALGVTVDGKVGSITLDAAKAASGRGLAVMGEYQAQRLMFLSSLPTWRTFGLGWTRRVAGLPLKALTLTETI